MPFLQETTTMSFKEIGLVLLFLAAWIVLNRWVLPWFGVPTCMSGRCQIDRRPPVTEAASEPTRGQDALRDGTPEPDDPNWDARPTEEGLSAQQQNP
jgi:hypothetical protein